VDIDELDATAHVWVGVLSLLTKNFNAALAATNRAVELSPNRVGMKAPGIGWIKREAAYRAVRMFGWPVFRAKSYRLKNRMADWLPLLDEDHSRDS
jgi:hypothetical protein